MADKFLNLTAVQTIKTWADGKYALDADLDALDAKVDDIIAEGGEPNVIEVIKKNGTAQTVTNKEVDLSIPTLAKSGSGENEKVTLTEGQNSYDVPTKDAMEAYVSEHGGVIQKIKQNGTEMPIDSTDKSVNFMNATTSANGLMSSTDKTKLDGIEAGAEANVQADWNQTTTSADDYIKNKPTIPTATSDLTNDSDFQTGTEVQSAIDTALTSAMNYKGSVATVADLPSTGNKKGDFWNVTATGENYAWDGSAWDLCGNIVDASVLWTSQTGQSNTLEAATVAEINAILNA